MAKGSPTITIRLPGDLLARLRAEAERRGVSASELIRAGLQDYVLEPTPEPVRGESHCSR